MPSPKTYACCADTSWQWCYQFAGHCLKENESVPPCQKVAFFLYACVIPFSCQGPGSFCKFKFSFFFFSFFLILFKFFFFNLFVPYKLYTCWHTIKISQWDKWFYICDKYSFHYQFKIFKLMKLKFALLLFVYFPKMSFLSFFLLHSCVFRLICKEQSHDCKAFTWNSLSLKTFLNSFFSYSKFKFFTLDLSAGFSWSLSDSRSLQVSKTFWCSNCS